MSDPLLPPAITLQLTGDNAQHLLNLLRGAINPTVADSAVLAAPVAPDPAGISDVGTIDFNPQARVAKLVETPPVAGPSHRSGIVIPAPEKNTARGIKLRGRMDKFMFDDLESAQNEFEDTMTLVAEAVYMANPHSTKHRHEMYQAYVDILVRFRPELPEESLWHTEIVEKYAEGTLVYRITHTCSPGGGPIQSRTAIGWLAHHLWNICSYTRDPTTQNLSGLKLLRGGLYGKLEHRLRWCVREYGLVRYINPSPHLDRPALQLIIEQIIAGTTRYGRRSGIQTLCAISFAFYGAFRSGSLQANHKDYLKDEMYLKIGDCSVEVQEPGSYSLTLDVKHWKGYHGPIGKRSTLTFGPVSKGHNLIFEAPMYFVLDLLGRGALEGIDSIDDLFSFDGPKLPIRSEFLDRPVFIKRTARGHDLMEGVPIGPHHLTAAINHYAIKAGLKSGSIHAIRRGSGDKYANAMGKDRTLLLMNHGDRTGVTFDEHYSTGLRYVPLVGIQLDDFAGNLGPVERATLENKKLSSPALDVLIRRSRATNGPSMTTSQSQALSKEQLAEIEEHPEVVSARELAELSWEHLSALFPQVVAPYSKSSKGLIPKMRQTPTDASPALVETRVRLFTQNNEKLGQVRKKITRKTREQILKAKQSAGIEGLTIQEKGKAVGELENTSLIYDDVYKSYEEDVKQYLEGKRSAGCNLTIPEATAKSINLPEEIREEMATSPSEDLSQELEDEDEEENLHTTETALPALSNSPLSDPLPASKISAKHGSLKEGPAINLDDDLAPGLQDDSEPDALGLPLIPLRQLMMRYLYAPIQAQQSGAVTHTKGEKAMVCLECHKFNSRILGKEPGHVFSWTSAGHFERHRKEKHGRWANLELLMQTDDPKRFNCPTEGCQHHFDTALKCLNHCRNSCVEKDQYAEMYQEFQSLRPAGATANAERSRQDRRRDDARLGSSVQGSTAIAQVARTVANDLQNPQLFEQWYAGLQSTKDIDLEGYSLEELQEQFKDVVGHSLESLPKPLPFGWQDEVTVLGANFMDKITQEVLQLVQEANDNLSDYDSDDDP